MLCVSMILRVRRLRRDVEIASSNSVARVADSQFSKVGRISKKKAFAWIFRDTDIILKVIALFKKIKVFPTKKKKINIINL